MSNVGNRIQAARTAKNLTQGELGRKAGIEQARLSRIERGSAIPSIDEVENLARGMKVSVSSLVDEPTVGTDRMSPALRALVADIARASGTGAEWGPCGLAANHRPGVSNAREY